MRIVSDVLLSSYEGKMINIHPSLLPAFKGAHAVEQAIEYGVKVFGITVHWVDASLDGGKIIAQQAFSYDGNDADEVHRIGQKIEHTMYVEVINKLLKENYCNNKAENENTTDAWEDPSFQVLDITKITDGKEFAVRAGLNSKLIRFAIVSGVMLFVIIVCVIALTRENLKRKRTEEIV